MFNKVAIIGTGLLGGSISRDLLALGLAKTVVGVCRSQETADRALVDNVVDQVLPISEAIDKTDLVVLSTPMQAMLPLLTEIKGQISKHTILTDVGSVKTDLYLQIKKQHPELLSQFVFAHPIAGGEHSGVAASRLGLFENKHVIITDTDEVSNDAVTKVKALWRVLGAKVLNMSLIEHDAIFAKTSHLPHVIAFSLVNYLNSQTDRDRLFDLAAAGFYDFTRIASSNAEMWRDICITNRDQVLNALDGFRDQVDEIKHKIEQDDQQGILDYFNSAKIARDSGLLLKTELTTKKTSKRISREDSTLK